MNLRYFNPCGAHPSGKIGEDPAGIPNNLMPYVTQVAVGQRTKLQVFGNDYNTADGSCIRDYVHVQDLAEAHIAAMNFVEKSDPGFTAINIGTGSGTSVYEVLEMVQDVTGISIEPIVGQRREGDPPALVADVSLAKELLGWQSSRDLREIVSSAWDAWQVGHK